MSKKKESDSGEFFEPDASSAGMEAPVEQSATEYAPVPEKPKLAVGTVSTRALNSLPEGMAYPEPVAKGSTVRESIAAGQSPKE